MIVRIAGTVNDSIVDGPGIRFAVFTQGCGHGCPGCHNPETHGPADGREADTAHLLEVMKKNPLLDGLTLSGGEPFLQAAACAELAREARAIGLNVWAYSGFTFEQLAAMEDPAVKSLLEACDVLVDGPFVLEQRTLELRFRGSKNQRLINVPASLERGEAVMYPL